MINQSKSAHAHVSESVSMTNKWSKWQQMVISKWNILTSKRSQLIQMKKRFRLILLHQLRLQIISLERAKISRWGFSLKRKWIYLPLQTTTHGQTSRVWEVANSRNSILRLNHLEHMSCLKQMAVLYRSRKLSLTSFVKTAEDSVLLAYLKSEIRCQPSKWIFSYKV